LVRQLDARSVNERDDAERKLIELGAGVLPLLPSVGEQTPAETASRVSRVQQHLLRAQAMAATSASVVTLKGVDLSLLQVLEAMAAQTGNPIADHRQAFGQQQNETLLTVDFEKTPFWRALDNVLDQGGLTLYGFTGKRGAFVVSRPSDMAPRGRQACYAGVFRMQPLRFEAVRDLRNDKMQSLKLFLELSWEPRLQPFAILQPLAQVTATTDSGDVLRVAGTDAEPEILVRDAVATVELEIPLALPPRGARKISVLKGKLMALVPGPREEFRFSALNPAPGGGSPRRSEQRKAGTTVAVDHLRKNNDAWELGLRMKFDSPASALESHRSWVVENTAYFEGADKRHIEAAGMEQTLENRDESGMNYFFELPDGPRDLTFVYRTPIMIFEVPIEYEFRDLQLP
jgi:hypothetical protein